MSREFVDPYIDQTTGILRNLVGATTYDELANAEGELVALRISELLAQGTIHPNGTLEDLQRIHGTLFRDIFDWAGRIRTIEIRKNVEGSEFFLPSSNIEMGIAWAQEELSRDNMLKGMDLEQFAERLAYHYDNYNFVHPFREGNGRTQRLLWTLICHDAGYDLDWCQVSGSENDEASRAAAEDRDYSGLVEIFSRIATPCDPAMPIVLDAAPASHLR